MVVAYKKACDIKTVNLLPNTMAKQKAVEHDAVEAILHRGDIVTDASSSNVFVVRDGQVIGSGKPGEITAPLLEAFHQLTNSLQV